MANPNLQKLTISGSHKGIQMALQALAGQFTATLLPYRPAEGRQDARMVEVVLAYPDKPAA